MGKTKNNGAAGLDLDRLRDNVRDGLVTDFDQFRRAAAVAAIAVDLCRLDRATAVARPQDYVPDAWALIETAAAYPSFSRATDQFPLTSAK